MVYTSLILYEFITFSIYHLDMSLIISSDQQYDHIILSVPDIESAVVLIKMDRTQ